MSNPMFTERRFTPAGAGASPLPTVTPDTMSSWTGVPAEPTSRTMTIGGTCSAAGLMLVAVGLGAWFGWGRVVESTGIDVSGARVRSVELQHPGWLIGGAIFAFALAIVTIFKPKVARFSALPYALAEGVVLGMISHLYDVQSKGVAIEAVIATCAVFSVMLVLYGLRILRATPRFVKGVIAATFGVMALYMVGFIASLFGADLRFWSSTSAISILFSVAVVGIAAFNLIIDFDFIERGSKAGYPAYMEWYGAFGLILTLVWLYLELLRLLSKLQRR